MRARDHRAGFRADRLLATEAPVSPGTGGAFAFLVGLSAVLLAVPRTALAAAIWLLAAGPGLLTDVPPGRDAALSAMACSPAPRRRRWRRR